MNKHCMRPAIAAIALGLIAGSASAAAAVHDVLIRGGTIYDGSGDKPYVGDLVIDGDKIAYVGPHKALTARRVIDARGEAVSPGFINMLSQSQESLLADGRGESELVQGVTLEVTGEGDSMGPLTDAMAAREQKQESDIKYPITWRTLDGYLETVARKGISPNIASMVGAATVRANILGYDDVQPTPAQLDRMRKLVRQAMRGGALGVSSALIYIPGTFAKTPELIALATVAGECGGIYTTHMRSEGSDILGALDEAIAIAKSSGAPAEIYHLKAAGRANWSKLPAVVAKIDAARRSGVRITADMYPYTAAATGLDASFPHWVMEGGLEAWISRMKDPAIRVRLLREMQKPDYESALAAAGPEGTLLLGFKNPSLKPFAGKTLGQVARIRHESPEEAAIDLVIEDDNDVGVAYTLMSRANLRKEVVLPWMSFNSDEAATAPEGVFLKSLQHPRAYGAFARVLAKYVREEKLVNLPDAIHRLSGLPAANLSLRARGLLRVGYFADVAVFNPATVQDHATYAKPQQLATGVQYVFVNGGLALANGRPTGAHTGRVIYGRAWTGYQNGGCRASAKDWQWAW